jgi:hypothetical protein
VIIFIKQSHLPLIYALKYFRILLRIRRDINEYVCTHAMPHSAGLFVQNLYVDPALCGIERWTMIRAMPHGAGSKWYSAGSIDQTLKPCCITKRNNLSKIRS